MTALDLQIRPASTADAAALAAFVERVFRVTYEPHYPRDDIDLYCSKALSLEQQLRELVDPDLTTAVAIASGEIVGYTQLRAGAPPPCVIGPDPFEIKRLYVDPRWHGGGVARALMVHAIDVAQARGARTLYLSVWQHNHRAIAFYAKHGFGQVGLAPFVLGTNQQLDPVMVRPLDLESRVLCRPSPPRSDDRVS